MASVSSQSPAERDRLEAIWQATDAVRGLHEATKKFVREQGITELTAENVTLVLRHGDQWIAAHGPLPESGIRLG